MLPLQRSCREIRWGLFGHLQPSHDKWLQDGGAEGTDTKNMAHALTRHFPQTHTFQCIYKVVVPGVIEIRQREPSRNRVRESIADSKCLLREIYISKQNVNIEREQPGDCAEIWSLQSKLYPKSLKGVLCF